MARSGIFLLGMLMLAVVLLGSYSDAARLKARLGNTARETEQEQQQQQQQQSNQLLNELDVAQQNQDKDENTFTAAQSSGNFDWQTSPQVYGARPSYNPLGEDMIDRMADTLVPSGQGQAKAVDNKSHTRIIIMKNSNALTLEQQMEHAARLHMQMEHQAKMLDEQLSKATRQEETKKHRETEAIQKNYQEQDDKERKLQEQLAEQRTENEAHNKRTQKEEDEQHKKDAERKAIENALVVPRWQKHSWNNFFSPVYAMECDLNGCFWPDGGCGAFDSFGHFELYYGGTKYRINIDPTIGNMSNQRKSQTIMAGQDMEFKVTYDMVVPGIFEMSVKGETTNTQVESNSEVRLEMSGGLSKSPHAVANFAQHDFVIPMEDMQVGAVNANSVTGTAHIYVWCLWANGNGGKDVMPPASPPWFDQMANRYQCSANGQTMYPQVNLCLVPMQNKQASEQGPTMETSWNTGQSEGNQAIHGQTVEISSKNFKYGFTVFLQWGFAPLDSLAAYIAQEMQVYKNLLGH